VPDTLVQTVWNLPGPRRFRQLVASRLNRGVSCTVALPQYAHSYAVRSALMDSIDTAWLTFDIRCLDEKPKVYEAILQVAETLGARLDSGIRRPGDLLTSDALAGRRVAVDAWQASPAQRRLWREVLTSVSTMTKEVESTKRPTFLTVTRPDSLVELSDLTCEGHDWLGVVDRVDTALYAYERCADRGVELDEVTSSIAIELTGWDLEFVDHLLSSGWREGYTKILDALPRRARELLEGDNGSDSCLSTVPSWDGLAVDQARESLTQAQFDAWRQGLLEIWPKGKLAVHRGSIPVDQARGGYVWRGQVATLFPLIEEIRIRLASQASENRFITGHHTFSSLLDMDLPDLVTELGRFRNTFASPSVQELMYWIKDIRNSLAHFQCVPEDRVRLGMALASEYLRSTSGETEGHSGLAAA
jgi:hypothetical protein